MVSLRRVYGGMSPPFPLYLLKVVLPSFVGSVLLATAAIVLLPVYFGEGFGLGVMLAVPPFVLAATLLTPLALAQRRSALIDQEMHLFITRIGVLSSADVSRKGIFNILSEMREYGELAREINKVYTLVDRWNVSIAEACRVVSRTTPSTLFGDFLDRLAHAVETGEDPQSFFRGEQGVVLAEYGTKYQGALSSTEIMKEVYVAMVTATMFMMVLVSILPLLWPVQTHWMFAFTAVIFSMVEGAMLFFFVNVIPREHIWQKTGISTRPEKAIRYLVIGAAALSALLLVAAIALRPTEMLIPVVLAVAFTPLAVPGVYVLWLEGTIKRRDDNFAAFIRSLGGSTEVAGTVSLKALEKLRYQDFGPLTRNIDALFKRLSLGIDTVRSWRFFGAETGSDLISKFSTMYVEGTRSGARPKEVGEIISANFIALLGLRKMRYQSASNLTGLLYGVTVAITVPLFITVSIINRVQDLVRPIQSHAFSEIPMFASGYVDVNVLILITTLIVLIHALVASFISRFVAAGHKAGALVHFVGISWIGAITAVATKSIVDALIGA